MPRFQGKVAIITGINIDLNSPAGSSSGIGSATAVLFAKEGAKVTITGRKQDGLEAMLEAGAKEGDINVVVADVVDAVGREEVISSTIKKFGQLDILVSNNFYLEYIFMEVLPIYLLRVSGKKCNAKNVHGILVVIVNFRNVGL
ncbi:unnamed protein product [Strongylus vulgaris]|uniref:Uncharacterized protein n=1 Tax=Strongylus vulgaris TaxID=40348 RepID=A0A3P7LI64_STRVU|nr:unnamed protein product [Strongylus vulgaris]